MLATLEAAHARIFTKVQPPTAPDGRFAKDRFDIDLAASTVTCPNAVTVPIRPAKGGGGTAVFGPACATCPLATRCTSSAAGRTIAIGRYEAELARARAAQDDPAWVADYRATRPKVERKIGHLMRRRHGGRRARVRGTTKVAADFSLLAAAVNLARLGVLGLRRATGPGWQVVPGMTAKTLPHSRFRSSDDDRPSERARQPTEPATGRHQPPQQAQPAKRGYHLPHEARSTPAT